MSRREARRHSSVVDDRLPRLVEELLVVLAQQELVPDRLPARPGPVAGRVARPRRRERPRVRVDRFPDRRR